MKIAITGGRGFIGTHLCDRLTGMGHQVTILSTHPEAYSGPNRAYRCDITDSQTTRQAVHELEPDAICHLAAILGRGVQARTAYPVNSEGTYNVLKATYDLGLNTKFLFLSSCAVYGKPSTLPIGEDCPCEPLSGYGRTKLAAEMYCRSFSLLGVPIVIVRMSTVYGTGQTHHNIVSDFVDFARRMKRINLYGSTERSRDLVYIDDAISALVSALSVRSELEIINVGGGREIYVRDLGQIIGRIMHIPVEELAEQNFSPSRMFLSIEKGRKLLNYVPIDLEEGLTKYIEESG
jgi:UDP-glucose 4-epimerase